MQGASLLRLRSISAPGAPLAASSYPEKAQHVQPAQQGQLAGCRGEAALEGEGQGGVPAGGVSAVGPGPWPPRAGELHLPASGWGLPGDLSLRAPREDAKGGDWRVAPALLVEEVGLSCWHKTDTSFGLPKVGGWA